MDWHFLTSGAGKIAGDNLNEILQDEKLSNSDLLIRESFQNTLDETKVALINDGKVKIQIKEYLFDDDKKQVLIEKLHLDELTKRNKFAIEQSGGFNANHSFDSLSNDTISKPLRVIEISDYYTNGLNGDWNANMQQEHNKFSQFIWSLGKSEKNQTGTQLGSYGYGKEAFCRSSNIGTSLFYTKFDPKTTSDGSHTRFMGIAKIPSYTYEDKKDYNGFCYLGENSPETDQDHPKQPLVNNNADEYIKSLSFTPRSEGETGLSIFLIDCDISVNDIKNSIEMWWWPLLMHPSTKSKVEIEVIDNKGGIINIDPSKHNQLHPFIKSYRNLIDNIDVMPLKNKYEEKQVTSGLLSLRKDKDNNEELNNKVAFIRDNKLVIEYHEAFKRAKSSRQNENPSYGFGCFTPHSDYEPVFRMSEPPAHSRWIWSHERLKRNYGPEGCLFVKRVISSIEDKCDDFMIETPDAPSINSDSFDFFNKLYSKFTKSGGRKGKDKPPNTPRAISITKKEISYPFDEKLNKHELKFQISLVDDKEIQRYIGADCKISIKLNVNGNDYNSATDSLPISVLMDNFEKAIPISKDNKEFKITMADNGVKGTAIGKAFADWEVVWIISAEIMDE